MRCEYNKAGKGGKTPLDRINKKSVQAESGCIEYTGSAKGKHGHIFVHGKNWLVHRVVYMANAGLYELPTNRYVCHSCDNPSCINPDHLWLGDAKSNIQDMIKKGRNYFLNRTHCPQGHPYSGDNLYVKGNGSRGCKTCTSARGKASYNKKRGVK